MLAKSIEQYIIASMASKRRFTDVEYEAAQLMRDTAKTELWDLLPKLRPDAVKVVVVPSSDRLDVEAQITGNTTPYSLEEVQFYVGELGLRLDEPSL